MPDFLQPLYDTFAAQPWLYVSCCVVLGLLVGSFLNVVIHRMPIMLENEARKDCEEMTNPGVEPQPRPAYNLVVPRSACPKCQAPITAMQNIPVVSWLVLRGKCANCKAPISARYMKGPVTGHRVEFSSSFIGRWGGTYKRDSFSGTLQYSHTGDQFTDANNTLLLPDASQGYIPEQKVMDLTANYGLKENYVLTFNVNNLLDTRYFTRRASAYPGPGLIGGDGRTFHMGVTVKY